MRELAFLWRDGESWIASIVSGPSGRGGSRESALEALRGALHERHRDEVARRDSTPIDPTFERLLGTRYERSRAESDRWWIEGIDSLGLDRCLLISPGEFAALLEQQCSRLRSGRGFSNEPLRSLVSVDEFPFGRFFQRNRILTLKSERFLLETPSHWSPTSSGLFSFDGSRLLALNRSKHHLEDLLRSEQRPLEAADPQEIASFFAEAAGRDGRCDHLIITRETLEARGANPEFDLDPGELNRVGPQLRAPAIATRAEGWMLEFSTLFGWSDEKQKVFGWQVEVSRRFDLDIQMRSLSERIFRVTPIVME